MSRVLDILCQHCLHAQGGRAQMRLEDLPAIHDALMFAADFWEDEVYVSAMACVVLRVRLTTLPIAWPPLTWPIMWPSLTSISANYTTEGCLLATPLRERPSFDEVCEELWADAADLREQALSLQRDGRPPFRQ